MINTKMQIQNSINHLMNLFLIKECQKILINPTIL